MKRISQIAKGCCLVLLTEGTMFATTCSSTAANIAAGEIPGFFFNRHDTDDCCGGYDDDYYSGDIYYGGICDPYWGC